MINILLKFLSVSIIFFICLSSSSYADFYVIPVAKKGYVDTSSGDAVAEDILSGKKVWVDGNEVTGNIEIMTGDKASTIQLYPPDGPIQLLVPEGYYDGSGAVVTATESEITGLDADLSASNIKTGATIFGVNGSVNPASGNAADADVLVNKTYSNDSGSSTGNMHNQADTDITPNFSSGNHIIPAGYYNGSGAVVKDANLTSDTIRCGTTIYGIKGRCAVGDTGPAGGIIYHVSDDGLSGKEFAAHCVAYFVDWGGYGFFYGADSLDDGRSNTNVLIQHGVNISIRTQTCDANPNTSWYIPAVSEIRDLWRYIVDDGMYNQMINNDVFLWTSTEVNAETVKVLPLGYVFIASTRGKLILSGQNSILALINRFTID